MIKKRRRGNNPEKNSENGAYTDKAHDAAIYFMNLASRPSKQKGMRRPKRPENMDPEELENTVSAYNEFKEALDIAEEHDGTIKGNKRKMYDALLAIGRNFSQYQEAAEKAIKEAEKEPAVEAEYVEDERTEYDPFHELIHAQAEEEGEAGLSADELEAYSMQIGAPAEETEEETAEDKRPSMKELVQATKEKIKDMKQRYDGMIERAKKMLGTEGYSDISDGYREVMKKNSEMIERYDRLTEKANGLLEKQADIKKALVVNGQHEMEMAMDMHATEYEITQFWIGRLHERMNHIKEKQLNLHNGIDETLQNKTEA